MTSRQRAIQQLISLGVKYAPAAYASFKDGQGPAKQFAERQVSRRNAKNIAMEHAAHLVHGSVLPVYDGDQRVWVVFSGDLPIASHPVVSTPLADLLQHYDLDKRITVSGPGRRNNRNNRKNRQNRAQPRQIEGSTGTGWPEAGAGETPGA